MKRNLIIICAIVFSFTAFAQRPNLGSAYNYVLFSSNGAVSNTGNSLITGNIGNNISKSTAFGNVDGVMEDNNQATKQCAADLLTAYNQLKATIPTHFPSAVFGHGDTITAGIYAINSVASLSGNYILNGQGDTSALFIIQIQGAFSSDANSKIILINGAKACNIFWKIEGAVKLATNTSMKGSLVVNNAAIVADAGVVLEGRALTTAGAVTVNGIKAKLPLGFGLPVLTGPAYPALGNTACFALFSGNGAVTNSGVTHVTGDVGTNVTQTTGFNKSFVMGTVHDVPDSKTAACSNDLNALYTHLNTLPFDIQLLYPAQFGQNLALTPHTYLLDAATILTDTLFLNAQGNADAVFVLQINGAFSTNVNAKVILMNGAQAQNVFWKIDGAVSIKDNATFCGIIVCNNAAIQLNTGIMLNGRAFTTKGSVLTFAITATNNASCVTTGFADQVITETINVYPNPFNAYVTFDFTNQSAFQATHLSIRNILGVEVKSVTLQNARTYVEMPDLASGIYLYKLVRNDIVIQYGKLLLEE